MQNIHFYLLVLQHWNPALRSPRYYGHRQNAHNFLIRKPRQCGQPVDTANGQILKSQLVRYFIALTH